MPPRLFSEAGRVLTTDVYTDYAYNLKLNLTDYGAEASRMLRDPPSLKAIPTEREVTFNCHSAGVKPEQFTSGSASSPYPGLNETFVVVSTNHDKNGHEFVSTMEGRDGLPAYATQWHPERNAFGCNANATHAPDAVDVSYAMAKFFVSEARKSRHRFGGGPSIWSYPTLGKDDLAALMRATGPAFCFEQRLLMCPRRELRRPAQDRRRHIRARGGRYRRRRQQQQQQSSGSGGSPNDVGSDEAPGQPSSAGRRADVAAWTVPARPGDPSRIRRYGPCLALVQAIAAAYGGAQSCEYSTGNWLLLLSWKIYFTSSTYFLFIVEFTDPANALEGLALSLNNTARGDWNGKRQIGPRPVFRNSYDVKCRF